MTDSRWRKLITISLPADCYQQLGKAMERLPERLRHVNPALKQQL